MIPSSPPDSPDYEVHPVQGADGTWDALNDEGYGYSLGLASAAEVALWLAGYNLGAEENQ